MTTARRIWAGSCGAGGAVIDGYLYPAGTYVLQFMDFSQAPDGFYVTSNSFPLLLRGCRFRTVSLSAPGLLNCTEYNNFIGVHYCDIGVTSAVCTDGAVPVALDINGTSITGVRILRNYMSYVGTGVQPNAGSGAASVINDTIENYVEKLSWFAANTPGQHLNGICVNGGNPNWLLARNYVVAVTPDEAGNVIDQTDCLGLFEDFGSFPGTGTNSDGSVGYVVSGNYVGGTGYCIYLNASQPDIGMISNLRFTNNLVTTSVYPAGGSFGPLANAPVWGTQGNSEANNLWADGPNAGMSFG